MRKEKLHNSELWWIAGIAILLTITAGCKKDENGDGLDEKILLGKVYAPDGTTPIAGATVYIPVSAKSTYKPSNYQTADCEIPFEAHQASACTDAQGNFSLDISDVTTNNFTLKIWKGTFMKIVDINLGGSAGQNIGDVLLPANPDQGAGNFAVVTGSYDRMQDILAKLGMGELDDYNMLVPGTEKFDLYDGNSTLTYEYPGFLDLFENDPLTDAARINNYDIVFINCGNDFEYILFENTEKTAIIKNYVNNGGRLYVTDWSYDFVEQVFPEFIDFFGSDEVAESEAEYSDEAEQGNSDITTDATIHDSQLSSWLDEVLCEGGSCLNSNGTLHIAGFLPAWALINGAHPSKSSAVKIWISGSVEWYDSNTFADVQGTKPLTVSFNYGLGRVLYSSYHTEEENPSSGFWPQERVLQYLIFQL